MVEVQLGVEFRLSVVCCAQNQFVVLMKVVSVCGIAVFRIVEVW